MMTSFRRLGFLGGVAVPLLAMTVGCNKSVPIEDLDGSGGGGGAASGGAPATGGASGDTGGAGGFGGFGGAHSACHEVVSDALGDGCDNSRVCNYDIVDAYCDDGNAVASEAFVACFRMAGGCHTPADPGDSNVRQCFFDVIAEHGTTESAAVLAAADEVCDTDWEPLMLEVFAVMAGSDNAPGLLSCVDAAASCHDAQLCLTTDLGVDHPASCE